MHTRRIAGRWTDGSAQGPQRAALTQVGDDDIGLCGFTLVLALQQLQHGLVGGRRSVCGMSMLQPR